ncbi:hypothetical protein CF15_01230 [Pyrodictium occultum]|uniref:Uncharacterized protein n=1 Tax=Pyrodictium occultum TaxID=2309 RepID=A0A0V8RU79_PYROC|nr:hypothetical protein [Pyrodictium occultum]KSW11498.1 hypothetical protein CF15_01230 [Pyrodictium occultum]
MTRCCRQGYPAEACLLLEALLRGYPSYFHREELNSDGRRLFERLARVLQEANPGLRRLVHRVRRSPTLENVLRLAEEFYTCNARLLAEEAAGLRQPILYRIRGPGGDQYY